MTKPRNRCNTLVVVVAAFLTLFGVMLAGCSRTGTAITINVESNKTQLPPEPSEPDMVLDVRKGFFLLDGIKVSKSDLHAEFEKSATQGKKVLEIRSLASISVEFLSHVVEALGGTGIQAVVRDKSVLIPINLDLIKRELADPPDFVDFELTFTEPNVYLEIKEGRYLLDDKEVRESELHAELARVANQGRKVLEIRASDTVAEDLIVRMSYCVVEASSGSGLEVVQMRHKFCSLHIVYGPAATSLPPAPEATLDVEAEVKKRVEELAKRDAENVRIQVAKLGTPRPGRVVLAPPQAQSDPPASGGNPFEDGAIGKVVNVKIGRQVLTFCYCPPESFKMGSPASERWRDDNENQVEVTIRKGYWMAETEVTQGQWEALMGSNPSEYKGADLPVETVTWDDVQLWIRKLNEANNLPSGWKFDLPTEAQWEYACRAGTTSVFAYGNSLSSQQANFDGDYPYGGAKKGVNVGKTVEVKRYEPNAWGLYDMHGNVWEWCSSYFSEENIGGTDPKGPRSGEFRVYRGGGWMDRASDCRAAARSSDGAYHLNEDLGFRPVLVPSR